MWREGCPGLGATVAQVFPGISRIVYVFPDKEEDNIDDTFMFVSYESGNVVHRGEMQLTIVEKSVQVCGVGPARSNIPNAQRK